MSHKEPTHVLRVTRGINQGASVNLKDGQTTLIGSDPGCDVVLAAPGIESRHCIVTIANGRIQVRSMEGKVHIDGGAIHPESAVEMSQGLEIDLNDATTISISLGETRRLPAFALPKFAIAANKIWAPAGLTLAVLGCALFLSTQVFSARTDDLTASVPVEQSIQQLQKENVWTELKITTNGANNVKIRGIMPSHSARQLLAEFIQAKKLDADWKISVGEQIAKDVNTILRTKGITAETRYIGRGNVAVTGNFGDERPLRAVLANDVIGNVAGLVQTIINNHQTVAPTDNHTESETVQSPRIKVIVRGDDPYLVSEDGRVYYTKALVPGVGQFIGIDNQRLQFKVDGRMKEFVIASDLPAKLEHSIEPVEYFQL